MKLVISIVQDQDANDLVDVLTDNGYRVTKLATTGGFLKAGNTTLMIGVEDENVDNLVGIIEEVCKTRQQMVASPATTTSSAGVYMPYPVEIKIGGATIFVVDVEKFVKI
ncbi:cyclic-di-AMP receptor [Hathewaya histolytica]|uniref:Protein from nitrogen regulatory protein P-II (GLNB) family n=1 Tax=Hathewaya histolytica TaxID=1498 RepID=A0A4U9QV06_HATHI|nr:cyclic-di-AMP receptor [Hathewaya histolytica]VTQ82496.1 Protein from nitrogen regulatory protein P-II (GLNB) family [Hathewaya histolytica]